MTSEARTRWNLLAAATIACALAVLSPRTASADIVQFDKYCPTPPAAALRQTMVIIDDDLVYHAPPDEAPPAANRSWIIPLRQIADVEANSFGAMMPGELLTVFIARRDTSELVPVFHGCSPNLSAADVAAAQQNQSTLSKLIFGESSQEDRRQEFEDGLVDAYGLVVREDRATATDADPAGFFRAIASAPFLYSLENGIPRVLLITPFGGRAQPWKSPAEARQDGFATAKEVKLDFQRAEVYVVATQAKDANTQNFAEAVLLGSRGHLAGWRQTGLPPLETAPAEISIYGGSADIAGMPAPVQMRLASDSQGSLVNSWIEVSRIDTIDTPITGKMICTDKDNCIAKGDGRLFAQAWSDSPLEVPAGASSMFREDLAWSGFRQIQITIKGESADVWIFEPNVVIQVSEPNSDEKQTLKGYSVPAALLKGQRF